MIKKIAHVVVDLPIEGHFDYALPEEYREAAQPGMRVLVSFARQKRVGVIVDFSSRSSIPKLNSVLALLDEEPVFSPVFLKFAETFALRFGCSLGEALFLFLPKYLRGGKKLIEKAESREQGAGRNETTASTAPCLTELIFDRGLEKRWDVLKPLILETLAAGKGVIFAIPDATYLEPVLQRLKAAGIEPVVLSQGTDKEEFEHWNSLRVGVARVAVGFISAVLTPVRDTGLIVIFEEDSSFFKNDQSPFYHARDAAFLRARIEACRVVCVTSAPSIEVWHEVEEGRARFDLLQDTLPPVKFLDLRNFKMKKDTFVSPALRQHLEWAMKEGRKALLYIQAARGVGGIIEELKTQFAYARIAGYDKASTKFPSDAEIVVATQAVFRHRYAVRFDIIAVLDIDWEFHKSDYRAAHGAFALTQHLRQMAKEFVLLQTRHMESELLHYLADDDIKKFYRKELGLRKEMDLPPFRHLVALVVRSSDSQLACDEAKRLYDNLVLRKPEAVELHEPQQDRSAIVRGKFRWCVMLQARSLKAVMGLVKDVQRAFRGKKDSVVTVNVNP